MCPRTGVTESAFVLMVVMGTLVPCVVKSRTYLPGLSYYLNPGARCGFLATFFIRESRKPLRFIVVPGVGIEPTLPCGKGILSPLPIVANQWFVRAGF